MRYEFTDHEWAAIKPMLPNKPRGVPRVNDRRVVCTENFIHVSESPNVGDDDRAILPLPGPVRLAVQVEEPT